MVPAQSSSSSDCHTREDGQRSVQIGWRLPAELVARVQALAREQGTRPGKLVTEMITRHFGGGEHIWSAAELESRVKFPEHLFHGKWH